jgi:hypothetical protein
MLTDSASINCEGRAWTNGPHPARIAIGRGNTIRYAVHVFSALIPVTYVKASRG